MIHGLTNAYLYSAKKVIAEWSNGNKTVTMRGTGFFVIKDEKLSDDEKTKGIVKDSLDSYIDRINVIGSYENEKFYNIGFMDAINLIFECIGRC